MLPRVLSMLDVAACPEVLNLLREAADVVCLPADQDVLRERIGEFDGYLASLHVRLDRAAIERASRLRVVATPSTGMDHIDIEFAKQRGIAILSLKDDTKFLSKITATAELAWGLLLSVVRRISGAAAAANQGDWARDRFRGRQLSGKTLGIVGYGRLGRIVAEYGKAFRMQVLACDVREVAPAPGIRVVPFDQLLKASDVVSLHVHLTEENRGLIGPEEFVRMKPGAVLINTSRGAIVDEAALLHALEEGRLAGAGLDVIEGEWRSDLQCHPLIQYARTHDNLLITPHVGGVTHESQAMAYERTVQKLVEFLCRPTPGGRKAVRHKSPG